MNNITENYQLNSILDIYNGRNYGQNTKNALQYYIYHNSIPNGIVLSDKVKPINGIHAISNMYYYSYDNKYDDQNINNPFYDFYPLLTTYGNTSYGLENNYKLISAKDIDFENAYLKYGQPSYDYDSPISYYELSVNVDENTQIISNEGNTGTTYSFGRGITSYINNTYDLLNVVDYLLNRVKALNFLMDTIKGQKNIIQNKNNT